MIGATVLISPAVRGAYRPNGMPAGLLAVANADKTGADTRPQSRPAMTVLP